MSKRDKLLIQILSGGSDNQIPFEVLCSLLKWLGFDCRVKGSHHIFYKNGVQEILNLQPNGALSKSYQIKQIRNILVKYKLGDTVHE